MTYKELVNAVRESSLRNVSVNSFYQGTVAEVLPDRSTPYPAIVMTTGVHSGSYKTTRYNFSLFFIDLLIKGRSNKIDIQSEGMQVLKEIINRLLDIYDIEYEGNYNFPYTLFTEKFPDDCAGCYVNISLVADDSIRECYIDDEQTQICE